MNPLAGKPLDYIIGRDDAPLRDGRALELGYDAGQAPGPLCIKYGNLFDQRDSYDKGSNKGEFGPYRAQTDTAEEYDEGVIDPDGAGWWRNIDEQIARAQATGWRWIEWDNPDAYTVDTVLPVYDRSLKAGLRVIAKNPLLVPGQPHLLLSHPAVDGAIVERGAGNASLMQDLRRKAGKPDLPVWFVAFREDNKDGRDWAKLMAEAIARAGYVNMHVTYSGDGEYTSVEDIPTGAAMPQATQVTPADIIAKAQEYLGKFGDADAPRLAQAIGERYPEMAAYCRGIGPDTPWCGVFNAFIHMLVGIRPAYTKNSTDYDDFAWADAPIEGHWGTAVTQDEAQPGDTIVLRVPHHITFLLKDNGDGTFQGLGGNQSNAVTVATFRWGNVRGIVRAPGADTAPARPSKPSAQFEKCIPLLLAHEGGNDDDPRDPGGRTSRGILQSEWDRWRQTHPGLPSDVWEAPQDQVIAIYKQKYWDAMWCDQFAAGVDYAVFDYGVNSGIGRSAKVLQRLVGADVDGEIGPETVGKAARADTAQLINQICDERLAFLQGLGTWPTFGRGWSRRVSEVRANALKMVGIIKPDEVRPTDEPEVELEPDMEAIWRRIEQMTDDVAQLRADFIAAKEKRDMPSAEQPQMDWGKVLAPVLKPVLDAVMAELVKQLPTLLPKLIPGIGGILASMIAGRIFQPPPPPQSSGLPQGSLTGVLGTVVAVLSGLASAKGWIPPDAGTMGMAGGVTAMGVGGAQAAKDLTKAKQ